MCWYIVLVLTVFDSLAMADAGGVSTLIDDSVRDLAPKINETVSKFENLEQGQASAIKTTADHIIGLLMARNLAYKLRIIIDQLGVHPQNRFGMGVEAFDVHELLMDILRQGFSWLEVVGARCFEVAPSGTTAHKQQVQFQKNLHDASDGLLALMDPADLRFLTVTCSHTLQGLRCVKHGTSTTQAEIETNGKISMDKVTSLSAE